MIPTSRAQFKTYCLRRLGHPVITINLADEQVEDRIDEAMWKYREYHHDASERVFYKHQITEQDKTNRYITLADHIFGVTDILPMDANDMKTFFSFKYQFMKNEVFNLTRFDIVPYFIAMHYINTLDYVLEQKHQIRFNRHTNTLHIDTDWNNLVAGNFLVVDCYSYLDPDEMTDVWSDGWLQRYATALIKRNWGEVLKKFSGTQLIGGVQFSGQEIWSEADQEAQRLEEELYNRYTLAPLDRIG